MNRARRILGYQPTPRTAVLVAVAVGVVAISQPVYAGPVATIAKKTERLINGKKIKRNTISGKQIKNNSLTGRDIKNGSLRVKDLRKKDLKRLSVQG